MRAKGEPKLGGRVHPIPGATTAERLISSILEELASIFLEI
jgi:hypothetical protein